MPKQHLRLSRESVYHDLFTDVLIFSQVCKTPFCKLTDHFLPSVTFPQPLSNVQYIFVIRYYPHYSSHRSISSITSQFLQVGYHSWGIFRLLLRSLAPAMTPCIKLWPLEQIFLQVKIDATVVLSGLYGDLFNVTVRINGENVKSVRYILFFPFSFL